MALFGLEESDDYGAQGALSCASRMLEKLEKLNEELSSEMAEPLTMGIGIHTGEAVIGQMGPPKTPVLTALGDAVNTAARLESATKELGKPVVVSRDTLEAAHVSAHLPLRDINLRGRTTSLAAAGLNAQSLSQLINIVAS